MNKIIDSLSCVMDEYGIKYKKEELEKVAEYADFVYKDKKRFSGKSVLEHTLGVAKYVAALKLDDSAIYAALLHEAIKYDEYSKEEMTKSSSKEVVDMVNTISKLSYFNFRHTDKVDNEILRKMFIAIAKDIRTVIIKLADRLYNMQNIKEVDEKTAIAMARESLDIYAPIAHRLGMSKLKAELEDISFRTLKSQEYQDHPSQGLPNLVPSSCRDGCVLWTVSRKIKQASEHPLHFVRYEQFLIVTCESRCAAVVYPCRVIRHGYTAGRL